MNKIFVRRMVVCLFFIFLFVPFVAGLDQEATNIDRGDGPSYVLAGLKSIRLLAHGRVLDPAWHGDISMAGQGNKTHLVNLALRMHPQIGKYFIGVTLWLAGYRELTWREAMDSSIIFLARMPIAILGALTCIVVFYLGRKLGDWKTGVFASLFLAFNPLWLMSSRRIMIDTPAIFFSTLSILICLYATKSTKKRGLIVKFTFVGVALGLALGTKWFAGLTLITICVYLFIDFLNGWMRGKREYAKKLLIGFMIVISVSGLIFVASNPCLYPNPYDRFREMWEYQVNYSVVARIERQGISNPLYGFFVSIHRLLYPIIVADPDPPENVQVGWSWSKLFGPFGLEQEKMYDNWASYGTILWSTFFIFRLVYLTFTRIKMFKHSQKTSNSSSHILILLWLMISFISISLWMPMHWDRYSVPVLPSMSLIAGFGFADFYRWINIKLKGVLDVTVVIIAIFTSFIGSMLVLHPEYEFRGFQVIMHSTLGMLLTAFYVVVILYILMLSMISCNFTLAKTLPKVIHEALNSINHRIRLYFMRFLVFSRVSTLANKRIVDLGCGEGSWGRSLRLTKGGETAYLVGVDIFRPYIERSKKSSFYDAVIVADVKYLPFKSGAFDFALSVFVLEHLKREDGILFLNESERICSDIFVCITEHGYKPNEISVPTIALSENPFLHHLSGWSYKEFHEKGFFVRGIGFDRRMFAEHAVVRLILAPVMIPFSYVFPRFADKLILSKIIARSDD